MVFFIKALLGRYYVNKTIDVCMCVNEPESEMIRLDECVFLKTLILELCIFNHFVTKITMMGLCLFGVVKDVWGS